MALAGPFPSPQGSQVFAGQMAEQLASRGHEVHLLTYGQGTRVTGSGFVHHRVRRLPGDDASRSGPTLVKPLLDGLMLVALLRLAARVRFDVVHAHNYEAAAVAIAARCRSGVPVVYHSHNLMGDELSTYFERPLLRRIGDAAGAWLDRSVPRRADHVIALCGMSAERLRAAGVEPRRLSVIPAAVADVAWGSADAAKASLGLAPGDCVVGYCGNLDAYQNLAVLFEAARQAASNGLGQNLRFLVVTHLSARDIRKTLEGVVGAENATVIAAESFADAQRAIEASDIVVLPRRRGSGYPIKLVNYMSAGRAIVTAGCGGKVIRDGVDGVVVSDDDPTSLARAVASLAADPGRRRALGERARRRFEKEMTWTAVLPKIEAVYEAAVGRGASPAPAGPDVGSPSQEHR